VAVQVPPELQTPEVILRAMGSAVAGDTRSTAQKVLDFLLGGNPAERMGGVAPMGMAVRPRGPQIILPGNLRRAFGTSMTPQAVQPVTTNLERPWPGVYPGPLEAGRMQPKSFAKPLTFEMPQITDAEREALLRSLGMTGP